MRINWFVPVRALWSLLRWVVHQINVWGGILISIPLIPLIWLFVMIARGARRVGRMIRRAMRDTDHDMSDVSVEDGWMYGQVDGELSAFGMFAECHYDVRLTPAGLVVESRDGKTFLVTSFKQGQSAAELAPIFAEGFL